MNDLEMYREQLAMCDDKLIDALVERNGIIEKIMSYKETYGMPILQPAQEEKQEKRLEEKLQGNKYQEEIHDVFQRILRNSKRIQARKLFPYNIVLIGFMGAGKSTISDYLSTMFDMKLVVLDGYTENPGDLSWEGLKEFGELTVYDRTSYVESPLIAERISNAEIVITNKTPISRTTIDKCPNIRLIAVLATGYNVVDYNYAAEKGIPVVNVPTYGTASVSQFSIALLLEICHHIGHHDKTVHEGKWAENADWCYWDYPLIELEGKTM